MEGVTVYLGIKRRNSGGWRDRGFSDCVLDADGARIGFEE